MASQEDILKESQVRTTEHLEVHYTQETFAEAKEELDAWKADMPTEAGDYVAYEGQEAIEVRSLVSPYAAGLLRPHITEIPTVR